MDPISAGTTPRRSAHWRNAFVITALAGLIASAYAQENPETAAAEEQAKAEAEKKAEEEKKAEAEKKAKEEAEKKEKEKEKAEAAAAQKPEPEPKPEQKATPDSAQTLGTVTITGFRSSLAKSAEDKREGIGLSETIFAEDMGKFPDANIADALARIPGVTVTRGAIDGEGLNISIRGMGAAFTRTLLNGAPMASASAGHWGGSISANREVDIDFLPSELFSRVSVYKSQQASMLEGGIAGTVDMRSARPFDKRGFRSAFTVSGNYREQGGNWGDTGSALVSNTWGSEFGVLAGVAWGRTKYKTEGFQSVDMRNFQLKSFQATAADNPNSTGGGSQSTPDTVPSGLALSALPEYARSVLVPGAQINRSMLLALNPGASIQQIDNALMARLGRHLLYEGERQRASGVLSLEWRPNEDLDLYADTLVAGKSNQMLSEMMNVGTRANTPIPIGMEFDRSDCSIGCVLSKATFANTFWALEFRPMEEKTHFWSLNPGFEWRANDELTFDGHLNVTHSDFYRDMPTVMVATRSPGSVVNYDNSRPGEAPTYTSNLNLNDPSQFGWYQAGQGLSGLRMDLYERVNDTKGLRFNSKWGSGDFNVRSGVSFDDIERRYRSYSVADAWANVACGNNLNYSFFAPNTQIRQPGCDGRSTPGPVTDAATAYPGYGTGYTAGATTPLANLGSVVTNARIPQYVHPSDHGFVTVDWNKFAADTNYQYFRDNIRLGFNNGSGGYIREKATGLYTEANGRTKAWGHTLRYNAGVRYVQTQQTIGALRLVDDPRNAALRSLPRGGNGGYYPNLGVWAYEETTYHNVLPSFSLAYNVKPEMIARVSGSTSITRANPADLKQTLLTLGDQSARQGSVTNPKLKPFEARNLDLALEYYFSREAYLSASAFGKDIIGRPGARINTYTLSQLDQMYGTVGLTAAQQQAVDASGGRDNHLVEISEPYNINDKLKVRGLELTLQQPLDMLPVRGFGLAANYTYTKQKDEVPGSPPVAGVPPRTSNVTLYFERNGLDFRVSRQYTASHVTNVNTGLRAPDAYQYTTDRTQIDLSVGADLKRLLDLKYAAKLSLSVWNANDAISKSYVQFPNAVFDVYQPGPNYTLSLRTSF